MLKQNNKSGENSLPPSNSHVTAHTINYNKNTTKQTGLTNDKTSFVGNNNNYITVTQNNNSHITISDIQTPAHSPEMEMEIAHTAQHTLEPIENTVRPLYSHLLYSHIFYIVTVLFLPIIFNNNLYSI